jgi:hypothetical protein
MLIGEYCAFAGFAFDGLALISECLLDPMSPVLGHCNEGGNVESYGDASVVKTPRLAMPGVEVIFDLELRSSKIQTFCFLHS